MDLRILYALKELGPGSLSLYALYRLALTSGFYRLRFPIHDWAQVDLRRWIRRDASIDPTSRRKETNPLSLLSFDPENAPDMQAIVEDVRRKADFILKGRYTLFGVHEVDLGSPPDWHAFAPLAGVEAGCSVAAASHWSQYDAAKLPHDIKLVWEASRFGWVFPLVQAYELTGDQAYYEGFWVLFSSWLDTNPPHSGVHWLSGQEVALRLIALIVAAQSFQPSFEGEPQRWEDLLRAVVVHARRIPPTLIYARAQENNHLLTESAALYLVGLCFPELTVADEWKRMGRRWFEYGLKDQVFADGGYVQHSTNYQRLALQTAILVTKMAQEQGEPLTQGAVEAMAQMSLCLSSLVDDDTGKVPNYGPNDGALLLPLSRCPFEDYRPTLQAAWQCLWAARRYPEGPWDDLSRWLGLGTDRGGILGEAPVEISQEDFPQAGLHIIQSERLRVIHRAAQFGNRPGHSDQGHLDIWYQGINLARDPGTYLYNAASPWDNPFSGSWCHNTLMIDGIEPMYKAGRFLWLNRSKASLCGRWASSDRMVQVLLSKHESRRWRGIKHQRTLAVVGEDLIVIVDDVLGGDDHQILSNWSLADAEFRVVESGIHLSFPDFSTTLQWEVEESKWGLYRAGACVDGQDFVRDPRVYGWHAPSYAQLEPGLQLVLSTTAHLPARIITYFSFNAFGPGRPDIIWNPIEAGRRAFDHLRWGSLEWNG